MSRLPSSAIPRLLVALFALAAVPLDAQTIRSVSDADPRLVPGGDAVQLRLDGSGLDGVTEVRFLKDGREVRGLRGDVRATSRSVTISIVADRLMNPLDGVEIELRGPRIRRPVRVPAKVLVVADGGLRPSTTDGGKLTKPSPLPMPDPPASDPSIQVASIEVESPTVYAGDSPSGRVRLTAVSSEPVEVEIVSAQPGSLKAPGVTIVPAGALETGFELRAIEPGFIAVQARKVPYTSGPSRSVTVLPTPAPEVAVLRNSNVGDGWDLGDNAYGGPPPAFPVWSGQTSTLKIRLAADPALGATIHLTGSGPVSVPTGRLTVNFSRVLDVEVTFKAVAEPEEAVVTVHGYGEQASETVEVWPDQVFVRGLEAENCESCTSASVAGGDAVRLDVTLSRAAEGGGYSVPIQVSEVAALSPVALTIPAGQDSGELIVGAQHTDAPRTVTLTIGDVVPHTFTITVQPG